MRRSILTKLALGSVLLAMAGTASAAPFMNGSFETGTSPGLSSEQPTGSTAITGWTVSSGTVDYVDGLWVASNGTRSVDLAGSSLGSLSQTFDTTALQSYVVNFDMSKNPAGGAVPRLMSVTAGAFSQVYSFSANNSFADMMWAPMSFNFTATSNSTTLTFAALNDGFYGPVLDNVRVAGTTLPVTPSVPEPAAWAMMILGMGTIGQSMRRRRTARARSACAA